MQTLSPLSKPDRLGLSARASERSHTGIPLDDAGADFSLSHPENASARHHTAEAFSLPQSSAEPNDGNALRPETKPKQNNGRGESCSAPIYDPPCASDRIAHTDGVKPCQPLDDNIITAGGGYPISSLKLRDHQLREGARRLPIIRRAIELRAAGHTWESVGRIVSQPVPTLIRWMSHAESNLHARFSQDIISVSSVLSVVEHLTAADCAPQNHKAGRPPKRPLTQEDIARIKSIALPTNRTWNQPSIPEAVRRCLAAGALPLDLANDIRAREAAGLPLLTDAQRDLVALTEMEVRAFRSPNEANLDYVQSPGSLMLTRDPVTGEERFWQPGEAFTIDDGSINFGCCVPLERPGDKCWEKFGVIVGRFQFIPTVDHRTRAILGFSYTARPRDSYRAEDLTAAMHTVFAEHGLPRVMFLEFGTSNSKLVNETLARAGVEPRHVNSPHEKVVEKAFDLLWTKLSSMPGQVGRFRGEMEEENRLLTACKQGHKDPRKYFPSLPQVLAALRQAISESNAQRMTSTQYGSWIPGEWFAREAHKHTRPLAHQDAWMFSPCVKGPLLIRASCVGTSFSIMPGFSFKFHFEADFLPDYFGEEIYLHFNPFAPECEAMVVHAKTGKVLGPAQQINRHARYTRRAFGYGADPDIGHIAARKHAQALHRTMVAIKVGSPSPLVGEGRGEGPRSTIGSAVAETRDGLGNGQVVEINAGKNRGDEVQTSAPTSRPTKLSTQHSALSTSAAAQQSISQQAALIRQLEAEAEEEEA